MNWLNHQPKWKIKHFVVQKFWISYESSSVMHIIYDKGEVFGVEHFQLSVVSYRPQSDIQLLWLPIEVYIPPSQVEHAWRSLKFLLFIFSLFLDAIGHPGFDQRPHPWSKSSHLWSFCKMHLIDKGGLWEQLTDMLQIEFERIFVSFVCIVLLHSYHM